VHAEELAVFAFSCSSWFTMASSYQPIVRATAEHREGAASKKTMGILEGWSLEDWKGITRTEKKGIGSRLGG
jgi:hypothetical protein